jgi:hypothetical protein
MTNIAGRLAKFEKVNPAAAAPRVLHLVGCNVGESTETAIARWCEEHPDEPRPADEDLFILRAIASPQVAGGTIQ